MRLVSHGPDRANVIKAKRVVWSVGLTSSMEFMDSEAW